MLISCAWPRSAMAGTPFTPDSPPIASGRPASPPPAQPSKRTVAAESRATRCRWTCNPTARGATSRWAVWATPQEEPAVRRAHPRSLPGRSVISRKTNMIKTTISSMILNFYGRSKPLPVETVFSYTVDHSSPRLRNPVMGMFKSPNPPYPRLPSFSNTPFEPLPPFYLRRNRIPDANRIIVPRHPLNAAEVAVEAVAAREGAERHGERVLAAAVVADRVLGAARPLGNPVSRSSRRSSATARRQSGRS